MHLVQNGRLGLAKDRKSQGSTWKRSTCCSQMRNFHFTIDTFLWLEISKTPEHISSGGRKVLHIKPHPEVSKICWRGSRQGRAFWGVHPRVANCVSAKHGSACFYLPTSLPQVHNDCALHDTGRLGCCYFPTGRTVIFQLVARLLKIARISFHQNTAAMFVRCKHGLDIVCC